MRYVVKIMVLIGFWLFVINPLYMQFVNWR
jgi:hypothetical protein